MSDYDIVNHAAMLADTGRTDAYAQALAARVTPGASVLDLGTGSGVLALLACRAGAARVYAVDSDDIIEVARQLAQANGCADRITFLQARSTAIDLPERVDGIVADLHGALPLFRGAPAAMIDARRRFLKPGGWIVPMRDTLFAAVAASPLPVEILFGEWPQTLALDVSPLIHRSRSMWLRHRAAAGDLLTEPRQWTSLEYEAVTSPDVAGEAAWTIARSGVGYGLSVWFDCDTAPGAGYSNSPLGDQQHLNGQVFFPWPRPTPLEPGDRVTATLHADFVHADYVWRWRTAIEPAAGEPIRFAQTSFLGTTISSDRLRKRADTFVPTLRDDARIDARALALMAEGVPLGGIADALFREFPRQFRDRQAALTHAGDLSERYAT